MELTTFTLKQGLGNKKIDLFTLKLSNNTLIFKTTELRDKAIKFINSGTFAQNRKMEVIRGTTQSGTFIQMDVCTHLE